MAFMGTKPDRAFRMALCTWCGDRYKQTHGNQIYCEHCREFIRKIKRKPKASEC